MSNDDFIQLVDDDFISLDGTEQHDPDQGSDIPPWKILIVDDDEGVHSVTRLALKNLTIFDRPLSLRHCYSATESKELLRSQRDFAVILLDVVMETEDAGLKMVGYIREELQMTECRIILRTGQPGYAPELSIFNEYDINDYRTKADLTRTRLITSITGALRSYRQIHTITENRRGLELIINATSDLMERTALRSFSQGVLTQLSSLLDFDEQGIVCVQRCPMYEANKQDLYIVGAAGPLTDYISQPLNSLQPGDIRAEICRCLESKQNIYTASHCVIYMQNSDSEGAAFISTHNLPDEDDQRLIEVFAANISACFGNVNLVEKLNFAAYNDALTGKPNRSRFLIELDKHADTFDADHLLSVIDICHFADLNEGLGIDAGNLILKAVVKRLEEKLSESCFIARIGADVFGLIGPEEEINPTYLNHMFSIPFQIDEMVIPLRVNMGFCRFFGKQQTGISLLKKADIALTCAKKSASKRYEYFTDDMEYQTRHRLEVIRQLHNDFHLEKLELWYQPQINISTGQVSGFEALIRWPDGQGGFVEPPNVFIPLAEYSGLILSIGDWVINRACHDYKQLLVKQCAPDSFSVNVSMPQFRNPGFADSVSVVLEKYEIPSNRLVLEVTESLAMDDPESVIGILLNLKQRGIRTSIDDFGTGYSSLSYLKNLPIDCLKIDQSFIREIALEDERHVGGDFADTIVTLGEKLGMKVVAEGVETADQATYLKQIGCDYAQGFLYARPMAFSRLIDWLESYHGKQNTDDYDWVI